jgi:hypothetical protein
MSARARATTLRIINAILKSNSSDKVRGRLRGSLLIRTSAIKRLNDLRAILRMAGTGHEWHRSGTDTIRKELRCQAGDQRASADVRVDSIRRLMCLEGFLTLAELDTNPQDLLIRALVIPAKEPVKLQGAPHQPDTSALEQEFDSIAGG